MLLSSKNTANLETFTPSVPLSLHTRIQKALTYLSFKVQIQRDRRRIKVQFERVVFHLDHLYPLFDLVCYLGD